MIFMEQNDYIQIGEPHRYIEKRLCHYVVKNSLY